MEHFRSKPIFKALFGAYLKETLNFRTLAKA
jgi:hypothetical protein